MNATLGVEGYAKRTKRGELSLVPHDITLLSPCWHPLGGVSHTIGRRATHVSLLLDPAARQAVVSKAKVPRQSRGW